LSVIFCFFFFQAEDGIRDSSVTGVQTCALPISVAKPGADASERGPVEVVIRVLSVLAHIHAGQLVAQHHAHAGEQCDLLPLRATNPNHTTRLSASLSRHCLYEERRAPSVEGSTPMR